ncbi:MAE-28990/MAE-18760-like HEPN domain-containing protein [Cupriavidus necator]
MIDPSDALRDGDNITHPDPRNTFFGLVDSAGQVRPQELSDHLEAIQPYVLESTVPESVRLHFETAKNLYAYAWFVYRFHAVAEQQALSSLEFALRSRLESRSDSPIARRSKKSAGLSGWLKEAQTLGLIANSRLRIGDQLARERARTRFEFDQIQKMSKLGVTTITVDPATVQPTEEDLRYDWISAFIDDLPKIRNEYAHGSTMLHPTVLRTFDIACDLINQLFSSSDAGVQLQLDDPEEQLGGV